MGSLFRIAALLAALALPTIAGAQTPVRIGAINPFSGPMAQYGDEVTRGYELAAEEANAKGGIAGRNVVVIRGDAGNPQQGIAAVELLVSRDNVDAFIGTFLSAVSNAASDAAMRYNKIYWDTHALAADLTERGLPNFVRAGPNANDFAEVSVQGVKNLLAPKFNKPAGEVKVWIEHEDSSYGTSIAQIQKRLLEEAGFKVVGVGAHSFKAIDLTDSILRAKNAEPDVWLSTGYVPDHMLLLRTMRDQGFKPGAIVLLGTGDGVEFKQAFADYMDGVLVVGYPQSDLSESFAPGAAAFVSAYRAKYNRDPIAPQSLEAFVGAKMLLDAIAAAGSTDMEKVRAAAAAMDKPLHSYPNGFGVKFDSKMQNTRAFPNIVQWQSGKTVTVYPQEAATSGTALKNVPRQ
jgi:branched-chain amino acid transport system substrate-binding protein